MDREDIIRMAREAGLPSAMILHLYEGNERALCDSEIEELEQIMKFAELVAEHEREMCAKVCEDASVPRPMYGQSDEQWAAGVLAGRIRARGQA